MNGNGNDECAKADLDKILALAQGLASDRPRAKAVFAYGKANLRREFDLPPDLPQSQLFVGQRFHLKPLASIFGAQSKLCVVLLDRRKARLFALRADELVELGSLIHRLPGRISSDRHAFKDDHLGRKTADEVMHHYKQVAARLKDSGRSRRMGQTNRWLPRHQLGRSRASFAQLRKRAASWPFQHRCGQR